MSDGTTTDLEHQLEAELEIERFDPPAEFRDGALWADPAIYAEAAADPEAFWTGKAKELLDWETEPTTGLNDSDPPFYKWFEKSGPQDKKGAKGEKMGKKKWRVENRAKE